MKLNIIAAAAFAVIGLSAGTASAAPLGTPSNPAADSTLIEKVHGYHRSCQLGRRGWHYHPRRAARVGCHPRPTGYIWRSYGGRVGWWHPRRRAWHALP